MKAKVLYYHGDNVGFTKIQDKWYVGLFFGRIFKVAREARYGDNHAYKNKQGYNCTAKIIFPKEARNDK